MKRSAILMSLVCFILAFGIVGYITVDALGRSAPAAVAEGSTPVETQPVVARAEATVTPVPISTPVPEANNVIAVATEEPGEVVEVTFANDFPAYSTADEEMTRALQKALNTYGYELTVDGIYGPATANAVWKFQKSKNITVDSLAGKNTFKQANLTLKKGVKSLRYVANYVKWASKSVSSILIHVDRNSKVDGSTRPTISIYGRQADGSWKLYYCRLCGIGKNETPTPVGVFQISGLSLFFNHGSSTNAWNWAAWFNGEIAIHTTTYDKTKADYLPVEDQIGARVSNGCVRVEPAVARWIYLYSLVNETYVLVDDCGHDATLTGLPAVDKIDPFK